ncbi:MAG: pyruvate dehydrogenase (acetyl-transferring) E1 component subunit alpha, partial [Nitrospirae bacterium]
PYFVEATTYRFMGHSMADPAHGHYRTKEEVEEERKRDPLVLLRQTIMDQKLGTEADFKQLEREVGKLVAAAVKFADESPFPARTALEEDVYIEWRPC